MHASTSASSLSLRVLDRLESQGLAGWDPYDGLNAQRLPRFAVSTTRGRQVVIQLLKRSPDVVRRALGVPKAISAYTLGHVLMAYARLGAAGLLPDAEERAVRVLGMLQDMALSGWAGPCWGYHFDVQTRFPGYGRDTPNAVVTAFVAKGIAEATAAGLVDGTAVLAGTCEFITHDLGRIEDERGLCFLYTPRRKGSAGRDGAVIVHNANALCAEILTLGATVAGLSTLDDAMRSARHTASYQRADGSWPYAQQPNGDWVDGFHTGFVLEGLHAVAEESGDDQIRDVVRRGMSYYVERLFDADGGARYYDTKPLPYDVLSAAEGIEVLTMLSGVDDRAEQVRDRLVSWASGTFIDSDGKVAYRRGRFVTDRREFPRWSGAPMCSALAAPVGPVRRDRARGSL